MLLLIIHMLLLTTHMLASLMLMNIFILMVCLQQEDPWSGVHCHWTQTRDGKLNIPPPPIFARPHEEKSLFFLQGSMYHKLWQDDVIFWKYVFIAMHWCISRWRFSNINCTSICNNVMLDTKLSVYSLHNCLHGLDFSSIHLVYFTWSLYGVEAWGMRWRCRAF